MKTLVKIVLIILMMFLVSCGIMQPNIMIGPTGDSQETYIENMKYYKE